ARRTRRPWRPLLPDRSLHRAAEVLGRERPILDVLAGQRAVLHIGTGYQRAGCAASNRRSGHQERGEPERDRMLRELAEEREHKSTLDRAGTFVQVSSASAGPRDANCAGAVLSSKRLKGFEPSTFCMANVPPESGFLALASRVRDLPTRRESDNFTHVSDRFGQRKGSEGRGCGAKAGAMA